jgi:hypothetical protein
MSKRTTVTLMTKTEYPIETVYAQWFQSRKTTDVPVPMPKEIRERIEQERLGRYTGSHPELAAVAEGEGIEGIGPFEQEVMDVFQQVIAMKMPLGETLDFVFLIENLPVALREQLVRHRIGHKFGDQTGADILVSEVANNSTFWSQTTRIVDMKNFATNGEYFSPVWLEDHGDTLMPDRRIGCINDTLEACLGYVEAHGDISDDTNAIKMELKAAIASGKELQDGSTCTIADFYRKQMLWIQAAYRRLTAAGMPLEDARNILPVAMMHRFSWKTNLSSLMHVMSRRGCWLAQLGMWEPVIHDIVNELSTKVHPSFRRLIDPPCFNAAGKFEECAFGRENEEIVWRGNGEVKGEYPPCSLWINNDHNDRAEIGVHHSRFARYNKMMGRYAQLWGRDPRTGERKQLA